MEFKRKENISIKVVLDREICFNIINHFIYISSFSS